MMHHVLTVHDLVDHGGEPTILDLKLAELLGYAKPRDIRPLILRHMEEIEKFGAVHCGANIAISGKGRRTEVIEYWLTMEQALLVATLSDAPLAPDVRHTIIRVFVAWKRGELTASPRAEHLPFDRRQALAEIREARLIYGPAAARALWSQSPHLPRTPEMHGPFEGPLRDPGRECLAHLLEWQAGRETVGELIAAAMEGEPDANAALARFGIVATPDGVWLLATHEGMKAIWSRSRWRTFWRNTLRRLSGVTEGHERMTIGGHQGRPIWLPANLLT